MNKKSFLATLVGTALEFYDVTLYGYFSALLAPLFFPTQNPTLSLIMSFGAFAAGFLMRPFGGLFFGHLGDRYGRKQALTLAIFLVSIPTLIIGLLPPYAMWGILSPSILVLCRLLQGLCIGGEYSGAAVFISEHTPHNQKGFAGSILCAAAFAGGVIGSITGIFCTLSWMPSWAWRIPFIFGGILGLISFFYRRYLQETQEFEVLKQAQNLKPFPFKYIWKHHKLSLFCTLIMGSSVQVPFYIVTIYMSLIMTQKLGYDPSMGLVINTGLMILWMLFQPLVGYVCDRFNNPLYLMKISLYGLLITAYPLFYIIEASPSLITFLIAQLTISIIGVWYMGISPSLMPRLFPSQGRMSGMGVSFSLGQALFSGTTPLIITSWVAWTGNIKAPAFYLIITSLASLGALTLARFINLESVVSAKTFSK